MPITEKNRDRLLSKSRSWFAERRRRVVDELLERDGHDCAWCGDRIDEPHDGNRAHIDHRVPVSQGGEGDPYTLPAHPNLPF